MSSPTVNQSVLPQSSPSSSPILVSCRSHRLRTSARFPRNINRIQRFTLRAASSDSPQFNNARGNGNNTPNGGDSKPPNGSLKGRKDILLEYVKTVQPEFMELFVKRAPQQVVDAMRQTVTNMIGTLPPQFFAVTVTTVAENLAQLMYSVLMTGYMFSNAQYRLELQQSLDQVALPEAEEKKDVPDYAPGTQKKVSGEVIRWNNISGAERIDAVKYIELLEAEIEELNRQVGRKSANGPNELLDYLKTLEPQNLKELTNTAGEDVVLAMNTFIKRLLAVKDPGQMKTSVMETSAPELAKLRYWLMVVGYSICNIEDVLDYAPGTQKKVSGEVIRWNNVSGAERIDATKYIELLEAEIEELNSQTSVTETSAPELAKLLYWLMVVGYSIRNIEVRFDMERVLGTPPKFAELPPAENI